MQKGELLGELRGKMLSTTIKDITPLGIRLEINDQAQFTGTKYNANHMETVTVFQKTDGSSEWETKGIGMTKEGDMVVVSGRGKGKNTTPTSSTLDGDVVFMTQSPRLSWLNTTKGWVEGSGNQVTGEFSAKVYAKK